MRPLFLIALSILLPTHLISQQTYSNQTMFEGRKFALSGWVDSVDAEGLILLRQGKEIRLWGQEVVDPNRLYSILEGNEITCWLVPTLEAPVEGVCTVKQVSRQSEITYLDLFAWLPVLGIANYKCNPEDFPMNYLGGREALGYGSIGFSCRESNFPTFSSRPIVE